MSRRWPVVLLLASVSGLLAGGSAVGRAERLPRLTVERLQEQPPLREDVDWRSLYELD